MYINEHPAGTEITISTGNPGQQLSFTTTIRFTMSDGNKHGILADPVMTDSGKFADFSGHLLIVEMTDAEQKRPYRYHSSYCTYMKYNGKHYLLIVSPDNADVLNRRGAYRAGLCEPASIQIKGNTGVLDGYTKDLSVTGIGLVLRKEDAAACRVKIGDFVSVTFTVTMYDRFYRVTATVCRLVDFDDKHVLIGCTLDNFSQPVAALVTKLSLLEKKSAEKKNAAGK